MIWKDKYTASLLKVKITRFWDDHMQSEILFFCNRVVELWREHLAKVNKKAANSLAEPQEYENLFPDWKNALKTEAYLKPQRQRAIPADKFPRVPVSENHCLRG